MISPRERLVAAIRGGSSDRKPILVWPGYDPRADIRVVDLNDLETAPTNDSEQVILVSVGNAFHQSKLLNRNLTELSRKDPSAAQEQIESHAKQNRQMAERALEAGADGIFYTVAGADPSDSTPMEFGGLYLEQDRTLLEFVGSALCNIMFISGSPEYLDFLADLPAHALAYDPRDERWSYSEVRAAWPQAIAAHHKDADILFSDHFDDVSSLADNSVVTQNYV